MMWDWPWPADPASCPQQIRTRSHQPDACADTWKWRMILLSFLYICVASQSDPGNSKGRIIKSCMFAFRRWYFYTFVWVVTISFLSSRHIYLTAHRTSLLEILISLLNLPRRKLNPLSTLPHPASYPPLRVALFSSDRARHGTRAPYQGAMPDTRQSSQALACPPSPNSCESSAPFLVDRKSVHTCNSTDTLLTQVSKFSRSLTRMTVTAS